MHTFLNHRKKFWSNRFCSRVYYDLHELGVLLISFYDVARYEKKERTYLAQMDAYCSKKK